MNPWAAGVATGFGDMPDARIVSGNTTALQFTKYHQIMIFFFTSGLTRFTYDIHVRCGEDAFSAAYTAFIPVAVDPAHKSHHFAWSPSKREIPTVI